jgi:pectinesterase
VSRRRSALRKPAVLLGVLLLVFPLMFVLATPAYAATRCVNTGGTGGCYASIQAAVNAANGGDLIEVYPGTYDESVNLSAMNSVGNLSLITVNASGVPTPGTVTVDYHGIEAEFHTSPALNGNLTIGGFVVHSEFPGIEVEVDGGGGANRNIVIRNVTATLTDDDGISVSADGNVTISGCTASNNDEHGIYVLSGGDVVISDCTVKGNGLSGIRLSGVTGAVTISNCTASGNSTGFMAEGLSGSLKIESCMASGNQVGVWFDELTEADEVLVKNSIICDNGSYGLEADETAAIDAEGNWWGCVDGPNDPGGSCDMVDPGPPTVDFTPWISRITSSASPDPVTVGEPTVVRFRFHGGPPAVYLGEGPGDLRVPAPFTVSTDNGTLNGSGATVQEFINASNGILDVTLVPAREGTATVTVWGPCGLSDLEGATAVLGVAPEFVPEPGSVILLASGLMGLAGYAGLRMRKR